MSLKVFISESHNPHLNLATEEWIFNHLEPTTQILFLWRNGPTVVIGRNQNPWSEVNLDYLKNENIYLARRTSGGGAVYQDLGNTNFTFLSPKNEYSRANNNQIILNSLQKFGITGESSGRNDLVVRDNEGVRKFSGCAFREKQDRAFHHGTMLMNADLEKLGKILTPNPKKLLAKGKESVRARVLNLNELAPQIGHEVFTSEVIKSFETFYSKAKTIEVLNIESLKKIPELNAKFEELSSWDWVYGKTLPFTHQLSHYFSLGFFEFQLVVEDAKISSIKIYSDCLYPLLIDDLQSLMLGMSYTSVAIDEAFLRLKAIYQEQAPALSEVQEWFKSQIEI